jgi:hypothetical protein
MHVTITVLRASVFRVCPYSGTVKNQGLHIQKYPQAKRDESCRPWLRPGDHGHGASYQQAMEIGRASVSVEAWLVHACAQGA